MKTLRVIACAVLLATLAGCAVGIDPYPPYGPPVVTDGGDYWFDGVNTYYFEPGIGYYFFVGGVRHDCAPGWAPRPDWHNHGGGFGPGHGGFGPGPRPLPGPGRGPVRGDPGRGGEHGGHGRVFVR